MSVTVDIVVVVCQQGGGCSNHGSNSGGNFVVLVAMRAGIGQRNEIGWGEEENVVTMAAAMPLREGAMQYS